VVRTAILFSALVALAGCATADLELAEEPGYAKGYGDGCSTAQEEDKSFSTKRYRDEESFDSDRGYRAGWRQGYQQCKRPLGEPNDGGLVLGDDNRF
jgi:hypothetical protein